MIDDAKFFAWLDDALTTDEAERIAAQVDADPALAARAAAHRQLAARLERAFEPVLSDAPPPPRFGGAAVVDLASRRDRRFARPGSFGLPWAALAATLAIGIVAGQFVGGRNGSPVESRGGQLFAAGNLEQALDTQLASIGPDGGVRVGITFRDRSGNICRSFNDEGAKGLACHDGDSWRVDGLFGSAEGQQSDYRMASGTDPRIAALIDERISGEPLDATAERAARDRGWRQ